MKTNRTNLLRTSVSYSLFMLLTSTFILSSCKKEEETITEEDAAEVIVKSVEAESGGIQEQAVEMAELSEVYADVSYCGMTVMDTISKSSASGAVITYNLLYYWQWTVNCTNNEPSSIDFEFNGSSTYDAPRMASDDQVTSSADVSGLESTANSYIMSMTLYRDGSQQSKIRSKRSFESDLNMDISNLSVNKNTYEIESGSATVSFSGSASSGESVSFQGNIVFHGNGSATLTMPSGDQYTISL